MVEMPVEWRDALLAEIADAKHGQELALLDAENERRIAGEARAENQRLRDALKRIGDDTDPLGGYRGAGDFARSILREALAGDTE